ncbi:pole-organizing protein PopZ [soil metagenome]
MTDPTAQEPTMEEILASIRRIISEDDAPAEAAAPAPAPEPTPAPTPEPETIFAEPEPAPAAFSPALMNETPSVQEPEPAEEDVLELTDVYEAPAAESIGDLDVFKPEPTPAPKPSYDSLVGESASASAASAFAGFASSLKKPEVAPAPTSGGDLSFLSGSTVEGIVGELLKPLLKDWLDTNLPGIVEKAVKAEVERIARSAT